MRGTARVRSLSRILQIHSLADSSRDLDLDFSSDLESRVRALWDDRQYQAAVALVNRGARYSPGLLDQALALKNQSEAGNHDVSDYYLAKKSPTEAAEFLGPVEVRTTEDGRGRGVFLTADARAGDLLFVHNAIALLEDEPGSRSEKELQILRRKLLERVMERCRSSARAAAQVRSMAEYASDEHRNLVVPLKYFEKEAPAMEIFAPSSQVDRAVGVEDDRELWNPVWFSHDRGTDFWGRSYIGLWPLHSLINHSCCAANVSSRKIGPAQFVYAARDLGSGSELLRHYLSSIVFARVEERRSHLLFHCRCARCGLEERLSSARRWLDEIEEDASELSRVIAAALLESSLDGRDPGKITAEFSQGLQVLARTGLSREEQCSDQEKRWLRASNFARYLSFFQAADRLRARGISLPGSGSIPSVEEFLESCRETAPGSFQALQAALFFLDAGIGNPLKLRQFVRSTVIEACGHQREEVIQAIIRKFQDQILPRFA